MTSNGPATNYVHKEDRQFLQRKLERSNKHLAGVVLVEERARTRLIHLRGTKLSPTLRPSRLHGSPYFSVSACLSAFAL